MFLYWFKRYFYVDASEIAQARLKGLDTTNVPPQPQQKPHKDVNTFINNQLKFAPTNQNTIPPDQMKCNILKAKAEEQKYNKNGKEGGVGYPQIL